MANILNRAKLTSKSSNVNAVAKLYSTLDEAYISLTANNCNDYLYNDYNNAGIFGAKSHSHSTYETYIGYISGNSLHKLASFSNQQISLNAATTKIGGHMLPASNSLYNIGSHTNQWNKLYVSNGINDITSNEIEYLKGVTSSVQEQLDNKETVISLGSTQYALINDTSGKIAISTVTIEELNYLNDTERDIQAQINDKENVLTGAVSSITATNLEPNRVIISDQYGKITASSITTSELAYLENVTASIQTQLNNKESTISLNSNQYVLVNNTYGKIMQSAIPASNLLYLNNTSNNIQEQLDAKELVITGAASSVISSNFTSNYILISNASGKIAVSPITTTQLNYVNDVTKPIQNQIDSIYSNTSSNLEILNSNISKYVSQKLASVTADVLRNGTSNNIVINNEFNSDLVIKGTLTTSNLYVFGSITSVTTNTYETDNIQILSDIVDYPALSIKQNGQQNIAEFYNGNNPAMVITASGDVGIGKTLPSQKLDVVGNIMVAGPIISSNDSLYDLGSATKKWRDLYLSGNTISLNNTRISVDPTTTSLVIKDNSDQLTDITLSQLQLSSSNSTFTTIQYTDNKISLYTSSTTNVDLSNTTSNMSNYISIVRANAVGLNSNMLGYLSSTNTTISKLETNTSNYISSINSNVIRLDSNMSNYVSITTTNQRILDSNVSNYLSTIRSQIFTSDGNTSNYISNIYSNVNKSDSNMSNYASNMYANITVLNSNISKYGINTNNTQTNLDSNMSNYLSTLNTQSVVLNNNMSNYASNVNLRITSQDTNISNFVSIINSNLLNLNSNMSNYLSTTNTFVNRLDSNISNYINNINVTVSNSGSGTSSQWTTATSNIYYTLGSVGIGTNIFGTSNKLEIYGGDLNIANGIIKKTFTYNIYSNISPIIWYQFNENPAVNSLLLDSNDSDTGTKFNMTVSTCNFNYQYDQLSGWSFVSGNVDTGQTMYVQTAPSMNVNPGYKLTSYSLYSYAASTITPLIFEFSSGTTFVLRGIGQSLTTSNQGYYNNISFNLQSGTDVFANTNYYFGWKDGTASTQASGVMNFATSGISGYNVNYMSPATVSATLSSSYTFSSGLNRKYAYQLNFLGSTAILEYPPIALVNNSGTAFTLTNNITSATYGNGTYIVTASDTATTWGTLFQAFDKQVVDQAIWLSQAYYDTSGTYTKASPTVTNNIDGATSFTGEWLQIQLPNPIIPFSYSLATQYTSITNETAARGPRYFVILGSTNGTNWVTLDYKVNVSWVNSTTGDARTYMFISTVSKYSYFRIVINKTQGGTSFGTMAAISEWKIFGYPNVISKITAYNANSYLYQNAYLWNGVSTNVNDNNYLTYTGSATNIQLLLNRFHNNMGFSIHFVFSTSSVSSTTSQILYIGNTTPGDIIRVYITNNILYFQVRSVTLSSTAISANTYYVTDLLWSYVTGGNMTLTMYLNNVSVATNSATSYSTNSLLNVSTTGLVYYLGRYPSDATNDASPVTLQDFRIYSSTFSLSTVAALQYGKIELVHPTILVNSVRQVPLAISGNDYYYAFTNTSVSNTITFNQDTVCDVLLIGGGGGGGNSVAGGAGACIISIGYKFTTGTYTVTVGSGGADSLVGGNGNNGTDSSIGNLFVAKGGGGGNFNGNSAAAGGSSGGTGVYNTTTPISPVTTNVVNGITTGPVVTATYGVYGNAGGYKSQTWDGQDYSQANGGSGGGIGTAGGISTNTGVGAAGDGLYAVTINGKPYTFKSYFSPNSSFGVNDGSGNFYIGGGGRGTGYIGSGTTTLAGGLGGGGVGYMQAASINGGNGTVNTGSGGGGSMNATGGTGGSGIVIIRYTAPLQTATTSANYQLQRWNDGSSYYSTVNKFITYTDGNVGIGITNPLAKLHIGTGSYNTGTQNLRYFNYATVETAGSTFFTDTSAIFDSSIWVKSYIGSSSDERIKKNITDINDNSALEKIISIEPKTYTYVDPTRGTNKVYGFLAQQVANVIPEAVIKKKGTIPNIFTVASCNKNTITFSSNIIIHNDICNTVIDVIAMSGSQFKCKIIAVDIDNNSIIIDQELTGDKVFVYGSEVEDFHILDKSYIYSLNVCATQLLSDEISQMTTMISGLKSRIHQLQLMQTSNLG